jgi:hypothetical protein
LYNDPHVKDALVFRGGTALNKLFINPPARYSEEGVTGIPLPLKLQPANQWLLWYWHEGIVSLFAAVVDID